MTQNEFREWWDDFVGRWPDMGEWFAESRTEATQLAILSNWANALEDVTLAEALAVNRSMYKGDLACFTGKWDRDKIPAIVRGHVVAQRPPATTWTGPEDDATPRWRRPEMKEAMEHLLAMKKAGATHEECETFMRKIFPPEPIDRQPRFKCVVCADKGRLEIWHPERVFIADRDGVEAALKFHYQTSSVACTCKEGDTFAMRSIPLLRFNRMKHCPAYNGDVSSPDAVADFEAWRKHDRANVRNRENFEPAFASYNQQEAF